ncbi:MAG: fasciclin domain-containing protein, partial [Planctomycetota bacterium JB042]
MIHALRTTAASLALASTALAGTATTDGEVCRTGADAASKRDLVETAVAAGSFGTLAAALQAADLVDALKGPGPFTVFAPTDNAFAALPAGTVDRLLRPENRAALAGILTYHVVPGRILAEEVVRSSGLTTLNGQRLDLSVDGGAVFADGAKVVRTDIECSNGVIHVLDAVVTPATDDLVATAAGAERFGTLLAAAKAAGLAETLAGGGPFTVFAPTDDAFAALPEGTVESLLKPENRDRLAAILKLHVVSGRVHSDAAAEAGAAPTLNGARVAIARTDGGLKVGDATVVAADLDASNGVIHVI